MTTLTAAIPQQPLASASSHASPHARASVLCVDDELHVLDGIERVLRARFEITKVTNAADAIVAFQYGGPFAVIVCDFRLAETDGVQLLSKIRELGPDTVRLLLTGQATMDDAVNAINEGHIFGFIRKPCRPELLIQRVSDAVAQHRLLTSERELLEQTLRGSIKALTDLLALSCPAASGRATRVTRYACDLAAALRVERWEIEIAAMVSQIGYITLAPELTDRIYRGLPLNADEYALTARLPVIAEDILATIPRLEGVRAILRHAADRFDDAHSGTAVPVGARILRVAADFDTLIETQHMKVNQAVDRMSNERGVYDPKVIDVLDTASAFFGIGLQTLELPLSDVEIGMVFVGDVTSPAGILLIARGQDVTPSLLERIRNHWSTFAERQRVRVVRSA
jgi:response regulator RpfG family c-di-GMP phosphodiesterase